MNEIFKILLGNIQIPIWIKDLDLNYTFVNNKYAELNNRKKVDFIGMKNENIFNPETAKMYNNCSNEVIKTLESRKTEEFIDNAFKECQIIPIINDNGALISIAGIIGMLTEVDKITEKRNHQERIKYLSYTDILTGANNRISFEERAWEYGKEQYLPLGIIMGDINGLKLVNDTFGHQDGDRLLIELVNVLKLVCKDIGEIFRIGGDEFVILIPKTSLKYCETIIKRIMSKCEEYHSDLLKLSVSLGSSIKETVYKDLYETLKEAEDKVYRQKLLQKKSVKSAILNSLNIGLGIKSLETEEHAQRVILNAVKVGEKLNLEMSEIDELIIVAELHDIGKIGIDQDILLKPGKLTDEEYEIMKTHSEKGYRIIKASSELHNVALGVLHHHERWDGTGYPMGLKGEQIPLFARIITLVDSYDVITNDRIYKKSISKEEAIEEIKRCSGGQFDPKIVEVFLEHNHIGLAQ